MQINIGSALTGAAQLFLTPAISQLGSGPFAMHSRGMHRTKSPAATGTSSSANAPDRGAVDTYTGPLSGSVCNPPHTSNYKRRALAPAHCIAPSKTRRRRRRSFPGGDSGDQDEDLGIPGGNDGDSGSTGGGGGGDWGSDGEEEGDYFGDIANALWLWRALCVCSMLQVAHFLLLSHYKQANPTFATLSQSFFSSSVRPQPVHAP